MPFIGRQKDEKIGTKSHYSSTADVGGNAEPNSIKDQKRRIKGVGHCDMDQTLARGAAPWPRATALTKPPDEETAPHLPHQAAID